MLSGKAKSSKAASAAVNACMPPSGLTPAASAAEAASTLLLPPAGSTARVSMQEGLAGLHQELLQRQEQLELYNQPTSSALCPLSQPQLLHPIGQQPSLQLDSLQLALSLDPGVTPAGVASMPGGFGLNALPTGSFPGNFDQPLLQQYAGSQGVSDSPFEAPAPWLSGRHDSAAVHAVAEAKLRQLAELQRVRMDLQQELTGLLP